MPRTTGKALRLGYSIRDLQEELSGADCPAEVREFLSRGSLRLLGGRITPAVWERALQIVDTLANRGSLGLALKLLQSAEYQEIGHKCVRPIEYRRALANLLENRAELGTVQKIAGKVEKVITESQTATELQRHLANFGRQVGRLGSAARSAIHPYLDLLRGYDPAHDAAFNWDWHNAAWYAERNLPFPWGASNHSGVDLTEDECRAQDGWVLYIRRILTGDGIVMPDSFTPTVSSDQKYFALYNMRTGLLRVFVHYMAGGPASDRLICRSFCSLGASSNVLHSHPLFNHIGPICQSTSQSELQIDGNVVVNYTAEVTSGWIVLDFPLTNSPLKGYDGPLFLNTRVNFENVAQLSIEGRFVHQVAIDNPTPSLTGFLKEITGPIMHVGDNASSINKAGSKIKTFGEKMTSGGGDGALLVAAGTALATGNVALAAVAAGAQILRTFLNFGRAGGAKYSTYEGTLNLKGEIRDEGFRSFHALLMTNTPNVEMVDFPYFFKVHPRGCLGLLHLKRTPMIKLLLKGGSTSMGSGKQHYDMRVDIESNIEDLIEVNPASGLTLKDVKVQVVVQRPWWSHERDGGPFESFLLLGDGIKLEPDPTKGNIFNIDDYIGDAHPPMINLFPDQFEAASAYHDRLYVAHGLTAGQQGIRIGFYGIRQVATSVFLRLLCKLGSAVGNQAESVECLFTYRCDDLNTQWIDMPAGYENELPWP